MQSTPHVTSYQRGYADALAGRPATPGTHDWSKIEPYAEGYEDGRKARRSQRTG